MLKKKSIRLLASAGSLADIQAAIAKFYGGPKTLAQDPDDSELWQIVSPSTGYVFDGVRVRHLRGRYRFEMMGAWG